MITAIFVYGVFVLVVLGIAATVQHKMYMSSVKARRIYSADIIGTVKVMDECTVFYKRRTVWNLFAKTETLKEVNGQYYDRNDNKVIFED